MSRITIDVIVVILHTHFKVNRNINNREIIEYGRVIQHYIIDVLYFTLVSLHITNI